MVDPKDTEDLEETGAVDDAPDTTNDEANEGQESLALELPGETPPTPAQETAPDLLTLKDIAAALGVTYGRLRGFAEAEGVREKVGAVDLPGVKGVRYPAQAREQFAALMDAANKKLVTPGTAAAWLKNLRTEPLDSPNVASQQWSNATNGDETGLTVQGNGLMRQSYNGASDSITPAVLVRSMEAMEAVARGIMQAARPDRLLTIKEATAASGLSPATIRAKVPHIMDGRRYKWRESTLQSYLQRLEEAL